jgi:hypothetical protein
LKIAPLALVIACVSGAAEARSPRDTMFPRDTSCYLRHYDRAHLARHPGQVVEGIALGPDSGAFEADVLVLRLLVGVRDGGGLARGLAYCENTGGALSCELTQDGGWFTLTPAKGGALRMEVGSAPLGLPVGGIGRLTFGAGASDDDVFLIPPVPADACP